MGGYKQVILHRKAGENVPIHVFENLLKDLNTAYGFAVVDEEKVCVVKSVPKVDGPVSAEALDQCQKSFEGDIIFTFGSYPDAGFSQNAPQPFEAIPDHVAVFMSGTFDEFRDSKSRESAEYQAFIEYFKPKLDSLFHVGGNEIAMINAGLSDKIIGKDFQGNLKPDGTLVVMMSTGDIQAFWNNDTALHHTWGSISDGAYSQKDAEPEAEQEKKVEEKKPETAGSRFAGILGLGKKPAASTKPKATNTPPKNVVADKKTSVPVTGSKVTSIAEHAKVTPPPELKQAPEHIKSNKNLKRWYQQNVGYVPDNFRDRPRVASRLAKTFNDLAAMKPEIKATTEVKPADKPEEKKEDPPFEVENMPHVPAADREAIVEKFLVRGTIKRAIAESREDILNPRAMQALETELPSFAEQLGLKANTDLYGWTFEDFSLLCSDYPKAAAVALFSLRNDAMKLLHEQREHAPASDKKPVVSAANKFSAILSGKKKAAM